MPKIFEYFGFVFYFYSNEHEPIHVHVTHSCCETVFDLIIENGELQEISIRYEKNIEPLPSKDESVALEFIRKYWKDIVQKWVDYFVMKKVVKITEIKTRL